MMMPVIMAAMFVITLKRLLSARHHISTSCALHCLCPYPHFIDAEPEVRSGKRCA